MGNTNKSKYSIDAVGEKYDFSDLTEIINILRSPGGCPWDIKQTHESLKECLVEESGEVISAIDSHDDENLCEELGDLLLQVVMHAQIAAEEGRFTIDDVIQGVSEKMIRRHPHVFGDVSVTDDRESLDLWKQIKEQEKKDRL
ncbi:MAG: MazG family protein [Clostridiales bacterium]|nr:MazG family protein [Clostridiales bacterium]